MDPAWLAGLPELLARLAARWDLRLEPHFEGIEINYVAPATRTDGTRCVLKVSRHLGETKTEIAALQLWAGSAAAKLLDTDPEQGALLLERIEPGTMLLEIAEDDDDAATLITCGVLRRLWRTVPTEAHGLRQLESWCAAFDRNREPLSRGATGFPAELFQRADALRRELLGSTDHPVTLHGDMHHYNVLRSHRGEWLAIDPKGLEGDRTFDICQYFRNPLNREVPVDLNRRRLDIFCSELDLDRERARAWALVHAVLDACWDYEDGQPVQRAIAYAEQTLRF